MSVSPNEPMATIINKADNLPDVWENLLILAQMSKDINIEHSLHVTKCKRSSIYTTNESRVVRKDHLIK